MKLPRLRLVDVIVLLACTLLLIGFLAPIFTRTKEWAWFTKCSSNLRQIGEAMRQYAAQNGGRFPRTRADWDAPTPKWFTKPEAADPFATDGPEPNDVTASAFLLVRTQNVQPPVFLCPLTKIPRPAPTSTPRSNFAGPHELGYSFQNPFPARPAAGTQMFQWTNQLGAEFAIAADMNPGGDVMKVTLSSSAIQLWSANTRNHGARRGQNVLYGDGHVALEADIYVGMNRDNIYTFGPSGVKSAGVGIAGPPVSADDSILLPVATIDPGAMVDPWTRTRQWKVAFDVAWYVVLVALVIAAAAWLCRQPLFRQVMLATARGIVWAATPPSRRRRAAGLCPSCGYDMRATPNRCPECGRDLVESGLESNENGRPGGRP